MGFIIKATFVILVAVICNYFWNKFDEESIKGKKVLVTGASQNIGEEIAYQYATLGAEIVITARREVELKKVAEKCLQLGAKSAGYIVADMTDTDSYTSTIADAMKQLGGLDIVVLNHVLSIHKRWNGSEAEIEYVKNSATVNYFSYVGLASAALPHLKRSNGQLIVVSSAAGALGLPHTAAYGATKAAITNFFTSLQNEATLYQDKSASITVCILGAIDTKQARWFLAENAVKVKGYPVEDTASAIIQGGAARKRLVYAPYYLRFLPILRALSPPVFDKFLVHFLYGR